MRKTGKGWLLLSALCLIGLNSLAQDYPTLSQQSQRLKMLANSPKVRLGSITTTRGGNDIWMLTLGTGDVDNKPAMVVVGGVEGAHLLGVELATQFAEAHYK